MPIIKDDPIWKKLTDLELIRQYELMKDCKEAMNILWQQGCIDIEQRTKINNYINDKFKHVISMVQP